MKKLLLSAFAALACVAYANAEEVTIDFVSNQYGNDYGYDHSSISGDKNDKADNYLADKNNPTFTFTAEGVEITCQALTGSGVRFFQATSKGEITDITFRINKNSGITVAVPGAIISQIVLVGKDVTNFTTTDGEYTEGTFTGSAASVAFVNGGSAAVQIRTMTVTYEMGGEADTRENADLKFSEEKVTAYLGEEFTAPALTKATTAVVQYSSDAETVATVDPETGVVTLVGEGTARITAKAEANDDFRAGSASYLLTVRPAKVEGAIFTSEMGEGFTFENPEELAVWTLDSKYGLKASAYVSGKVNAAEAIAYASVDLSEQTAATLTFQQAMNQFKNGNDLIDVDAIVDYCKLIVREEGATEWVEIGEPTAPEAFSWTYYENSPVDLTAYCGKKIEFGFKYISTDVVAGTWEIKNINIVAEEGGEDSISEINAAAANGAIYDLQGRRVLAPARGLYIVNGKVVRF